MENIVKKLLLLLSVVFFGIGHTTACRCKGVSVADNFKYSNIVFKGKVISKDRLHNKEVLALGAVMSDTVSYFDINLISWTVAKVQVEKSYKGELPVSDTLTIVTPINGAACGFIYFKPGEQYIIYADKQYHSIVPFASTNPKLFWTNQCTRTYFWHKEEEDAINAFAAQLDREQKVVE